MIRRPPRSTLFPYPALFRPHRRNAQEARREQETSGPNRHGKRSPLVAQARGRVPLFRPPGVAFASSSPHRETSLERCRRTNASHQPIPDWHGISRPSSFWQFALFTRKRCATVGLDAREPRHRLLPRSHSDTAMARKRESFVGHFLSQIGRAHV